LPAEDRRGDDVFRVVELKIAAPPQQRPTPPKEDHSATASSPLATTAGRTDGEEDDLELQPSRSHPPPNQNTALLEVMVAFSHYQLRLEKHGSKKEEP
jgi:hypothetical protein